MGRPEVSKVMLYVSEAVCSTKLFLSIVGLAESNSEHPLGQAISNYVKEASITLHCMDRVYIHVQYMYI